jgi:hypothetical protein
VYVIVRLIATNSSSESRLDRGRDKAERCRRVSGCLKTEDEGGTQLVRRGGPSCLRVVYMVRASDVHVGGENESVGQRRREERLVSKYDMIHEMG